MKELPSPTLALLGALDLGKKRPLPAPPVGPSKPLAQEGAYDIVWAQHEDEVRAAQRLRWNVFVGEMGAQLPCAGPELEGHDVDRFDAHCEHLLVRTRGEEGQPPEVVGTYRVLTPGAARRAGQLYSDTEFDLSNWRTQRDRLVELGRSCVHPDHRQGAVILSLWGALAAFMDRNGLDTMIGCASISMRDGGHQAASLWRQLQASHLAASEWQVTPRLPLPIDDLDQTLQVEAPALIRGYLRCGARVLGAPAWDPDFNTADLPMMLRLSDLPARYRRHFLGPI